MLRRRMNSNGGTIPRLRGLPFFGRLFDYRRDKLSLLLRVRDQCGDIGRYRLGPVTVTVVSSPQLAHAVLVDQADAFGKSVTLRTYMRPLLGDGLITSEGELHRRQRKLIGPVFVPARVGGFADLIVRETETLAARLADGARIDLAQEMMRLSLVIIGLGLFSVDLSTEADSLSNTLGVVRRLASENAVSFAPFPPRWPTPRNLRLRAGVARLDETIYRMIDERRRNPASARNDVLSMLLLAQDEDDGSVMTDTQVRDEAITLFSAGHETSGSALGWSLYLLARHPGLYDRLCAEADSVLGGRPPAQADVPRLQYALQVFKEAMRLYPPVYMVARRALRDVELGGHRLAAGSIVHVNIYGIHRRRDAFHDPERFDPDRFSPAAEKQLPRGAYIPFGGGPRICVGGHLALLEGQLVLATLAQRLRVEVDAGTRVEALPHISLHPRAIEAVVRRRSR